LSDPPYGPPRPAPPSPTRRSSDLPGEADIDDAAHRQRQRQRRQRGDDQRDEREQDPALLRPGIRPEGRQRTEIRPGLPVVLLSLDRKSTRLNSSHVKISYAVFCLK